MVKKERSGSELFAVARLRVYIRVGREMYCGLCDHQQTQQSNQATVASVPPVI